MAFTPKSGKRLLDLILRGSIGQRAEDIYLILSAQNDEGEEEFDISFLELPLVADESKQIGINCFCMRRRHAMRKALVVFSVPFFSSFADKGPASA